MLQFSHSSELPYVTVDLPGIGGQLRATPEHFVVEEIPLYAPTDEGQHLYVRLTKVGLTTKEVERQLSRLFNLGRGGVGFAGMKDKHARTTQTFSLSIGHKEAAFADEATRKIEDALPVTVEWARFHRNKLKLGHLLGNRFVITISDLDLSADEVEARASAIVARIKAQGLPNYFGPQRFGIDGRNVERGLEVLQRKRYVKDRWLRRFLVSAYQSHLCNQYLAARVNNGAFIHLLQGDVAKKYETGGIFDVEELDEDQPRYTAHEISFTAPIYGPKMRAAQGESGELEASILAAAPVTIDHLSKAKVQGTRRLGRVLTPTLTTQVDSSGAKPALIVTFDLAKGAFATTVLGEIMKVDLAHAPDVLGD